MSKIKAKNYCIELIKRDQLVPDSSMKQKTIYIIRIYLTGTICTYCKENRITKTLADQSIAKLKNHIIPILGNVTFDNLNSNLISKLLNPSLPLDLEKVARTTASKIFDKRAEENKDSEITDFKNIDLNSIEASESRSFGGEYLCDSIWDELEMNSFLKKMNIPEKTIPILESLVVGRFVDPGSERYTKEWAEPI